MKKVCTVLCTTVLGFLLFSVGVFAETPDIAAEQEKILAGIDDATKELLENMGVGELGFDDLFHASPKKIVDTVLNVFRGKSAQPLKVCALAHCGHFVYVRHRVLYKDGDCRRRGAKLRCLPADYHYTFSAAVRSNYSRSVLGTSRR